MALGKNTLLRIPIFHGVPTFIGQREGNERGGAVWLGSTENICGRWAEALRPHCAADDATEAVTGSKGRTELEEGTSSFLIFTDNGPVY